MLPTSKWLLALSMCLTVAFTRAETCSTTMDCTRGTYQWQSYGMSSTGQCTNGVCKYETCNSPYTLDADQNCVETTTTPPVVDPVPSTPPPAAQTCTGDNECTRGTYPWQSYGMNLPVSSGRCIDGNCKYLTCNAPYTLDGNQNCVDPTTTSPTTPTTPTDPSTPGNPTTPGNPSTPGGTTDPSTPGNPSTPGGTTGGTTTPTDPSTPGNPSTPGGTTTTPPSTGSGSTNSGGTTTTPPSGSGSTGSSGGTPSSPNGTSSGTTTPPATQGPPVAPTDPSYTTGGQPDQLARLVASQTGNGALTVDPALVPNAFKCTGSACEVFLLSGIVNPLTGLAEFMITTTEPVATPTAAGTVQVSVEYVSNVTAIQAPDGLIVTAEVTSGTADRRRALTVLRSASARCPASATGGGSCAVNILFTAEDIAAGHSLQTTITIANTAGYNPAASPGWAFFTIKGVSVTAVPMTGSSGTGSTTGSGSSSPSTGGSSGIPSTGGSSWNGSSGSPSTGGGSAGGSTGGWAPSNGHHWAGNGGAPAQGSGSGASRPGAHRGSSSAPSKGSKGSKGSNGHRAPTYVHYPAAGSGSTGHRSPAYVHPHAAAPGSPHYGSSAQARAARAASLREHKPYTLAVPASGKCPKSASKICPASGLSGLGGHVCYDTKASPFSCGGCPGSRKAKDCSAIRHARKAVCHRGGCRVLRCSKGYRVNKAQTKCIKKK